MNNLNVVPLFVNFNGINLNVSLVKKAVQDKTNGKDVVSLYFWDGTHQYLYMHYNAYELSVSCAQREMYKLLTINTDK